VYNEDPCDNLGGNNFDEDFSRDICLSYENMDYGLMALRGELYLAY